METGRSVTTFDMYGKRKRPFQKTGRITLVILAGGLGLGGSESQLYLLLKHMDRSFLECHIVVFNPGQDHFREPLGRLGVRLWDMPSRCKSPLQRLIFVWGILRRLNPDIVHSWVFHDNPYAGLGGWLAGVPVRLGSQRNILASSGVQGLRPVSRFLAFRSVSLVAVNSEAARHEMLAMGHPPSRVALVPNCVDVSSLSVAPCSEPLDLSPLHIDSGHRVVGMVGNLRRQKNPVMFVETMAPILARFKDVRGLIVGRAVSDESDVPERIESALRQFNLDGKIILTGPRTDVPALMKRMNVFCLTSDYEGMPNVVLEAMAAGRPVVATAVGGVPELVKDGVNGFLVKAGDAREFTRNVERLLSNRDLATQMGMAGREIAQSEFACDRAALELTRLYCDALLETRIGQRTRAFVPNQLRRRRRIIPS